MRIGVVLNPSGTGIKCVVGPDDPHKPWTPELLFWAYPRPVPRTRMITIVSLGNSMGDLFESEGDGDVDAWRSFFQLWVPV